MLAILSCYVRYLKIISIMGLTKFNVRFGQHNARGIFGACPGEMLHLITLGWFKYCLKSFSHQAGAKQGKKSAALEH